jgi:hypothetical protein
MTTPVTAATIATLASSLPDQRTMVGLTRLDAIALLLSPVRRPTSLPPALLRAAGITSILPPTDPMGSRRREQLSAEVLVTY